MKKLTLIVLVFALLMQCTSKVEISQWRGPNRNGIYPETNLLKEWPKNGPELLWKYDDLGSGYASAAVTSEAVYTAGTIDTVTYIFKFDLNGELIWKSELGSEWKTNFVGINGTPLIYGDRGYLLGGLGDLFCFSTETGEIVWQKNLIVEFDGVNTGYGITENMMIEGDKLFVAPGGLEANIIALNKDTGELIWKSAGHGEKTRHCSPVLVKIGEKQYYITMTDTSAVSVDIANGDVAWVYDMERGGCNVPIYKDGGLFLMAGTRIGCFKVKIAEDGNSVEEEWASMKINSGFGEAVLVNNKVYGVSNPKQHVYSLDWKTGEVLDSVKINRLANICYADEMFYVYDYLGDVYLMADDEQGFRKVSSFHIDGGIEHEHCSELVIKDGRLYVRHDNSLFVYNISKTS